MMDWKDALASLSGLPEGGAADDTSEDNTVMRTQSEVTQQKSPLHVLIEKKGRGGKTATIIEGFEISDDEIDDIAQTLKKKLGTGGSSRGGEILIQGDRKADVVRLLKEMGFRVKG
ncbi:MAG: translation initiation factor [Muribaculaceae bacterium]|nr:translation initiation factor [Muribaculaceae bacterium]